MEKLSLFTEDVEESILLYFAVPQLCLSLYMNSRNGLIMMKSAYNSFLLEEYV
jgi:hypothetical protein